MCYTFSNFTGVYEQEWFLEMAIGFNLIDVVDENVDPDVGVWKLWELSVWYFYKHWQCIYCRWCLCHVTWFFTIVESGCFVLVVVVVEVVEVEVVLEVVVVVVYYSYVTYKVKNFNVFMLSLLFKCHSTFI